MTGVLLWLPVTYHVQYTVLLLVSRSQQGQLPKYFFDLMQETLSLLSSSPLRSVDRVHLLVPQTIGLSWPNIMSLQWLALCCNVTWSLLLQFVPSLTPQSAHGCHLHSHSRFLIEQMPSYQLILRTLSPHDQLSPSARLTSFLAV